MAMEPERAFDEVAAEADGFDVFDVETGNLVTSFETHGEFREHFSAVVSSVPDRSDDLIVFALSKGQSLGSFSVDEILATH